MTMPKTRFRLVLSASQISAYREDPLAWMIKKKTGIEMNAGPVATITGGMDRVMKAHYDACRADKRLPRALGRMALGVRLVEDQSMVNAWRHWRSGLTAVVRVDGLDVQIIGALDDGLVMSNGTFASLDVKTKGNEPKDDGRQWYQLQGDVYALLLQHNGFQVAGNHFLHYVWPQTCDDDLAVQFGSKVCVLESRAGRAMEAIGELVRTFLGGFTADLLARTGRVTEYAQFFEKLNLSTQQGLDAMNHDEGGLNT